MVINERKMQKGANNCLKNLEKGANNSLKNTQKGANNDAKNLIIDAYYDTIQTE